MGGKGSGGKRAGSGRKRRAGVSVVAVGAACEELAQKRRHKTAVAAYVRTPLAHKRDVLLYKISGLTTRARKDAADRAKLSPSHRFALNKVQPIDPRAKAVFKAASSELDKLGNGTKRGFARAVFLKPHENFYVGRASILAAVGRKFGLGPDMVDKYWKRYSDLRRRLRADLENYIPDSNNAVFD